MNRRAKVVIIVLSTLLLLSTGSLMFVLKQAWVADAEVRRLETRPAASTWMRNIRENVGSREVCCAQAPDPATAAGRCNTVTCGTSEADHNARFVEETERALMPGPWDCQQGGEDWTGNLAIELKQWWATHREVPPEALRARARKQWQDACEAHNAAVAARDAKR
jgi:hypothetical protein